MKSLLREALSEAIEFVEMDLHALTPAGEAMVQRWRDALSAPDVGVGLTRYAFDATTFMGHASAVMGEDPDGKWVLHEDVAPLIAAARTAAREEIARSRAPVGEDEDDAEFLRNLQGEVALAATLRGDLLDYRLIEAIALRLHAIGYRLVDAPTPPAKDTGEEEIIADLEQRLIEAETERDEARSSLETAERRIGELEGLARCAAAIRRHFKASEDGGYRSRDRQFALDMFLPHRKTLDEVGQPVLYRRITVEQIDDEEE